MKKDTIVQFVCFITNLEFEEFAVKWEQYAKEFTADPGALILQERTKSKTRYKYVSQHECKPENFRFAFMKGRNSEHFPEHKAKVVQTGGYTPVQIQCEYDNEKNDVKIIAFIGADEMDLDFYHRLTYRHLNIYEAYYESCTYSYIMEFFIQETDGFQNIFPGHGMFFDGLIFHIGQLSLF